MCIIPISLLIIISYIIVLKIALKQARNIEKTLLQTKDSRQPRNGIFRRSFSSHSQKGLRTVSIIIGLFLVCWLPHIFSFIHLLIFNDRLSYNVDLLIALLSFSNSIANPLVCVLTNTAVRNALLRNLNSQLPNERISAVSNRGPELQETMNL